MIRTPEPFWRTAGPKAPWGPFDPHAKLNFSFDLKQWVVSAGRALELSGCTVEADQRLVVVAELSGVIVTVRVQAENPASLPHGAMLPLTLRMKLSDGQCDDRTFYLLVRDR